MKLLIAAAACATLGVGCATASPDPAESGWWARLAAPPPDAQALDVLDDGGGGPAGADTWRVARDGGDRAARLCHDVGAPPFGRSFDSAPLDLEIRARARTEAGGSESYGVAFRREHGNGYLARVDTRNNNVRLYRQDGGTATLLAARDLGVSVGQWHELGIRAVAGGLLVALDGEPLVRVEDGVRKGSGLALWAAPDSRVCFAGVWLAPVARAP